MSAVGKQLRESGFAFTAVLRNPALRRLELAWTAAIVGHWAYLVAVSVFAYDAGGESAVGLIILLRLLPAAIASPFAGLVADRFRRERVLVVSIFSRIALVGSATVCVYLDSPPAVVYALAVAAALAETPLHSTQGAITPSLARSPAEVTAANAVTSTVESVATFLGPAIAGLLLGIASMGTVFAFTTCMLVVAAFFTVRIRTPEGAAPKAELHASTILAESLAGFRAIGKLPPLRVMVGLIGAQSIVAGMVQVYIVVLSIQVLNLGQGGVGYFNSALGVGGIIGGVLAFGLTGVRRLSPPFLVGVFLWGAPLVMVAVTSSSAAALMLFGVMGFGYALSDVAGFTIIQRSVPDDVLARVFGVIVSVCLGALGIGAAFAPHLTSWLGARHALVSTGVALVVLVGLFALRVTAIDAAAPAPDANELRLLGRVPIFAPLAGATLEQLAGRLVPLVVEPGTEVIRQGDHGDRFYVVAEGELDVAADGKEIASLSAGEYFGEIALLRDVPRTATVTAQTRSVLYALDREDFLSAVTGFAPSAHAAESIVSARLGSSQPADAADVLP